MNEKPSIATIQLDWYEKPHTLLMEAVVKVTFNVPLTTLKEGAFKEIGHTITNLLMEPQSDQPAMKN